MELPAGAKKADVIKLAMQMAKDRAKSQLQGLYRSQNEAAAIKKVKSYAKYGAVGVVGLCAVLGSYFTVPQTELCYITQWGKVVDADKGPIGAGLHWKIPFLQGVDCLQVTRSTDQLGVVAVTTKDSFTFTMKVGVTTEIPSTAVYRLLYQTGGMGVPLGRSRPARMKSCSSPAATARPRLRRLALVTRAASSLWVKKMSAAVVSYQAAPAPRPRAGEPPARSQTYRRPTLR